VGDTSSKLTEIAGFKVTVQELERVDRLVGKFKFRNRSQALRFLCFGALPMIESLNNESTNNETEAA